MFDAEDLTFCEEEFDGRVRLFPLPNLVLFPHVIQPLHIFEPGYRDMVEDALADDRLITIARLSSDAEDSNSSPGVFPTACLGQIAKHRRTPDGRYNLLLLGLRRVRILRELPTTTRFRQAEVRLIDDEYSEADSPCRSLVARRLVEAFRRRLPEMPDVREQLEELISHDIPLGVLTDIVSYAMELGLHDKIRLLETANVDRCVQLLMSQLDTSAADEPAMERFPPHFSLN